MYVLPLPYFKERPSFSGAMKALDELFVAISINRMPTDTTESHLNLPKKIHEDSWYCIDPDRVYKTAWGYAWGKEIIEMGGTGI